jgi:hypothetical protein
MTTHDQTFSPDAIAADEPAGAALQLGQIHRGANRDLGRHLRRLLRRRIPIRAALGPLRRGVGAARALARNSGTRYVLAACDRGPVP